MGVRRRLALGSVAVTGAVALTVGGALAMTPTAPPTAPSTTPAAGRPSGAPALGAAAGDVPALQEHLRRSPDDWRGWAALGDASVEAARTTGDPTHYARAEEAFARSLRLEPADNAPAVTGQAALAAALHDFPRSLELARRAQRLDSFHPAAVAVEVDALVELGRYEEAWAAVDRLGGMTAGFPAYSRASYALELRGDVAGARRAMELALGAASTPGQRSFAAHQLGQLALGQGDLDRAAERFAEALDADPTSAQALAGRARVAVARGDTAAALRDYAESTRRVPDPAVLAELGDLQAALGDTEAAEASYAVVRAAQRLLAAGGQDVDLESALFDADHGRAEAAVRTARAAYQVRRSIDAEDALAWSLHRAGRSAEALPHAEAALALGTQRAVLHYHLGMIRSAVGDREGARESLQRALALDPAFSPLHAPRARAELAALSR